MIPMMDSSCLGLHSSVRKREKEYDRVVRDRPDISRMSENIDIIQGLQSPRVLRTVKECGTNLIVGGCSGDMLKGVASVMSLL